MSACKTVSQENTEEVVKRPMTIISTICENDEVRLTKRIKAQKESFRCRIKNPGPLEKGERKNSIRTLLDESNPSFSFNMNMLYPKNVVTYSAYVKNMEGFVKNTLGTKKEIKLGNFEIRESAMANESYKNGPKEKKSETLSQSNKKIISGGSKKSSSENNINEENHPSLRRRYARLFISVPK